MTWACAICGEAADEAPLCFGAEAPWRHLVPETEFDHRVELTGDQCVIDGKTFFVRGHIEVPIRGLKEPLAFSVWSSLSEASFVRMSGRWSAVDRANDEPSFGWLSTSIPVYPETLNLKVSVQSRHVGLTPLFTLDRSSHPLATDQERGISVARWHELAHGLLHDV